LAVSKLLLAEADRADLEEEEVGIKDGRLRQDPAPANQRVANTAPRNSLGPVLFV